VTQTVAYLKGKYSFVALFDDGTLVAARNHAPLIIGIGNTGYFVSSDVLGFIDHTDEVVYLDNQEFVVMRGRGLRICNFDGRPVRQPITKVSREFADAEKGDYVHFTLKEIYEQPVTITKAGGRSGPELDFVANMLQESPNVYITGSGTSYNAALVAKHLLSKYSKVRAEAIIASEAQYAPVNFDRDSLMIALSQSGESADVLDAVSIARDHGAKVVSIVNTMNSSLTRLSSMSIGLNCGPEIGVAATKSFTSQLAVLHKIVEKMCGGRLHIDFDDVSKQISSILSDTTAIQELAKRLTTVSDIYVLGRGINYYIASEASLKLKELSYIHAEALPSGELKHGPLALLDSSSYVIAMNPRDSTYTNTLASVHEVKTRGATVIGISDTANETYDYWVKIPQVEEIMIPFVEIIPMQLLSYYAALERKTNPDYPRNLAKSVTVK
jgi:glucosamine--fructose-6-phosphate aminotransferase (isomerizing)